MKMGKVMKRELMKRKVLKAHSELSPFSEAHFPFYSALYLNWLVPIWATHNLNGFLSLQLFLCIYLLAATNKYFGWKWRLFYILKFQLKKKIRNKLNVAEHMNQYNLCKCKTQLSRFYANYFILPWISELSTYQNIRTFVNSYGVRTFYLTFIYFHNR